MTYAIHFGNDKPPKLREMLLAWTILLGLCFAWFACCVAPVCRSLGEAIQKELDRQKAEQAAKTPGGAPR